MKILQVNDFDVKGGAEKVCVDLHNAYLELGHSSKIIVGTAYRNNPGIIPHTVHTGQSEQTLSSHLLFKKISDLGGLYLLNRLKKSVRSRDNLNLLLNGMDDFDFPESHHILEKIDYIPDVIHFHNLHGDYFDLRVLPSICKKVPTILTLHDSWLLTGSCGHSLGCKGWMDGCSRCDPGIVKSSFRRYGARNNWLLKKSIYEKCQIFVTTPSQWLMNLVHQSILKPGIKESTVINNGVDTNIFRPGERDIVRNALNLPNDTTILLFAANNLRKNPSKDFKTLHRAIKHIGEMQSGKRIIFLALGESAPREYFGSAEIRYIPFLENPLDVAHLYQSADIYIHAAKADTFPLTVLEALACGTPVVASAVGGIPEQIIQGKTGYLVEPGNHIKMAKILIDLIADPHTQQKMGVLAAQDAIARFSLDLQVQRYIEWYNNAITKWK